MTNKTPNKRFVIIDGSNGLYVVNVSPPTISYISADEVAAVNPPVFDPADESRQTAIVNKSEKLELAAINLATDSNYELSISVGEMIIDNWARLRSVRNVVRAIEVPSDLLRIAEAGPRR